ncbi:MAG: ferrous iron transport protein B [Lachnoclostridium sp.]|nr:ferrous iron transport protein B [Lachnoclostridium sp.]
MRLSELKSGEKAVVVKILGHGAFRKRMIEMGFVRGREVNVLLHAPLHDPIKYSIMGYEVSLRRAEADLVEVKLLPVDDDDISQAHTNTVTSCEDFIEPMYREEKVINVALIGNPNCGKTSLFNVASGAKEHVGNYSGVTVDAKKGHFDFKGYRINIVDLPGTYSLTSYSPEELYVRRYLKDETPDVIINVVDGSNLERNLYLTTELIDMDRSMVIALNMYDELRQNGEELDYKMLGGMIGVPIEPTTARTGAGISELFDRVIAVYEGTDHSVRHIHVNLGAEIEKSVTVLKDRLKADGCIGRHFSPRYLAIKLLEHDSEVEHLIADTPDVESIIRLRNEEVKRIESSANQEDITSMIANEKYGFIAGALAETMKKNDSPKFSTTRIIDAIVTNKLFGFPLFFGLMFVMFWATFVIGSYPMEWIETAVSWLGDLVKTYIPDGILKDLITDGIIGGVGGVIVFLPNILILYLCISFMEDSGYMARAAFIMDKLMHRIGLHGKSFIPLVMGFGCTVPAIMASRSIESRSSRLITILINPFISCSARLPIYVLLIGTFFSSHAALVFSCVYLTGLIVAIITARLLRKFYFKADVTPFVMELPPYRIPTTKAILRHTWGKGEQYLRKMGGIILVASIIVWALNYFPHHEAPAHEIAVAETTSVDDSSIDFSSDSFLEMMGKAVNPVMEPLGFNWRATVAAIAGIPAKEIVVSTLGVLYTGDEVADDNSLGARLEAPNPVTGRPDFTPAVALSFMIFILLYCPCIATVTAIVKETGKIGYGLFAIIYNTAVAWAVAFLFYQIAQLI